MGAFKYPRRVEAYSTVQGVSIRCNVNAAWYQSVE